MINPIVAARLHLLRTTTSARYEVVKTRDDGGALVCVIPDEPERSPFLLVIDPLNLLDASEETRH